MLTFAVVVIATALLAAAVLLAQRQGVSAWISG
jgi:hypothetical protein